MTEKEIMRHVDHTQLKAFATWEDIKKLCDEAVEYQTASVCIPPCYIQRVKEAYGEQINICTVVGFPLGYSVTEAKIAETKKALEDGASEIDMVINIGDLKDGRLDAVREEIKELKDICGSRILKVIIETCLLTDEEKKIMCRLVTEAGADFIKTSTGFSAAGATFADVELFAAHVGEKVRIKAAGGISSFEDAKRFMELGADRLGTSRLVKLALAEEKSGAEMDGKPDTEVGEKPDGEPGAGGDADGDADR